MKLSLLVTREEILGLLNSAEGDREGPAARGPRLLGGITARTAATRPHRGRRGPRARVLLRVNAKRAAPAGGMHMTGAFAVRDRRRTPRSCGRGGRAVPANRPHRPLYGTTECKRISVLEVDGDLRRPGSVGRPLDGTQVRVLATDGTSVPAGEVGEFVVRGPHVMAGYWRAPRLSATRFRTDHAPARCGCTRGLRASRRRGPPPLPWAWRRPVQAARRAHQRRRDRVRRPGRTGVEQAVLVPPTDRRDMVLCVVTTMSPAEVLRHLGERLDPARVPGHCRVFDRFPLSSNGKTDRARLSRQVAGRQVHQGSRHEPPADGQVAIEGPSRSWSRRSSGRGVCVTSRPVLARGGVLSS